MPRFRQLELDKELGEISLNLIIILISFNNFKNYETVKLRASVITEAGSTVRDFICACLRM